MEIKFLKIILKLQKLAFGTSNLKITAQDVHNYYKRLWGFFAAKDVSNECIIALLLCYPVSNLTSATVSFILRNSVWICSLKIVDLSRTLFTSLLGQSSHAIHIRHLGHMVLFLHLAG